MARKSKMMKATFVSEISVIDPDTNEPVTVAIYKESAGGMFGVDSSYMESEEPVVSPFGNGEIEFDEP